MAKYPVAKRFGRRALQWGVLWGMSLVTLAVADLAGLPSGTLLSTMLSTLMPLVVVGSVLAGVVMVVMILIMLVMLAVEWFGAEVDEAITPQGEEHE